MSRIGFIGIGNMGKPMALNLLQAGHSLKVFDLSKKAQQSLVDQGAISATSLCDLVKEVDFVITMLPTGKEVKEIFTSPDFLSNAANNTIFIDCSTIDVESSLDAHSLAKQAGFDMLDAPVSGGTVGAEQAALTFMCGGDKKIFERCTTILETMGKKVVHCGGPSQGQVVKICNNMVAGSIFVVTSEAFALGEKLGVDRRVIYDVISASSGN